MILKQIWGGGGREGGREEEALVVAVAKRHRGRSCAKRDVVV